MSEKVNMTAIKAFSYDGKSLSPGQTFQARSRHAPILKALGKAKDHEESHAVGAISTQTYQTRALKADAEAQDNGAEGQSAKSEAGSQGVAIAALRLEYESVVGRKPFNGWDASTLREKIATYSRRDMRAES